MKMDTHQFSLLSFVCRWISLVFQILCITFKLVPALAALVAKSLLQCRCLPRYINFTTFSIWTPSSISLSPNTFVLSKFIISPYCFPSFDQPLHHFFQSLLVIFQGVYVICKPKWERIVQWTSGSSSNCTCLMSVTLIGTGCDKLWVANPVQTINMASVSS